MSRLTMQLKENDKIQKLAIILHSTICEIRANDIDTDAHLAQLEQELKQLIEE